MSPRASRRGWLLVWGLIGVAASRVASRTDRVRSLRWRLCGADPVDAFRAAPCYRNDGDTGDRETSDDSVAAPMIPNR